MNQNYHTVKLREIWKKIIRNIIVKFKIIKVSYKIIKDNFKVIKDNYKNI